MKRRSTLLATLAAAALTAAGVLTVTVAPAHAAALTEVTNFGTNPTNLRMYEYVPNTVKPALATRLENPPISFELHIGAEGMSLPSICSAGW